MKTVNREAFHFIGIAVRTTNENSQAMQDIPKLWGQFMGQGIQEKIPNKVDQSILCMYTEYEEDHTKPYTTLLGCPVSTLQEIPEGMRGLTVNGGTYATYQAKGDLTKGAVGEAWMNIWETQPERQYAVDYEVYGAKAANPADAEVDIFISIP